MKGIKELIEKNKKSFDFRKYIATDRSEDDCPFCNEDNPRKLYDYSSSTTTASVWIEGEELDFADGEFIHSKRINYCPMCGRKLSDD